MYGLKNVSVSFPAWRRREQSARWKRGKNRAPFHLKRRFIPGTRKASNTGKNCFREHPPMYTALFPVTAVGPGMATSKSPVAAVPVGAQGGHPLATLFLFGEPKYSTRNARENKNAPTYLYTRVSKHREVF